MSRRALLAGLGLVALLLMACGGGEEPHEFASIVYEPAPAPALRLTDQRGERFDLAELDGDVVAIFFGYTRCADVCPFTLGQLAAVKQALPPALRDRFQVIMVTTDPERDTPEVLADYLAQFDTDFIGLTGSRDQVLAARMAWGVRAEREPAPDAAAGTDDYTMLHASSVLVIDGGGAKRLKMMAQMNNEDRAADIAALVRGS